MDSRKQKAHQGEGLSGAKSKRSEQAYADRSRPEERDDKLTWASGRLSPETERDQDAPTFFTAVQEQLGLRLVSSKAPVEAILIDDIEKPSEK